jgi:hypothetical protein
MLIALSSQNQSHAHDARHCLPAVIAHDCEVIHNRDYGSGQHRRRAAGLVAAMEWTWAQRRLCRREEA